ncbi:MAG: hemolysin family protein [Candidatus Gastranaerophilales bacterium]|nr:hemolysin family protein [Candidatus Gastranaerophilales bacterium]
MGDGEPTASILLFLLLVLIDFFFYGFGAAIKSLNEKEVERRAEEDKDKKAIRLKSIIDDPSIYVNTVQLIVTLIHMIVGAFYLRLWSGGLQRAIDVMREHDLHVDRAPAVPLAVAVTVVSMAALLYILLTFGVLLPKRIAARMPERWAYACITPVYVVTRFLRPLTGLVTATTGGILFLFGVREKEGENDVTEEEIIEMVNEGHEQGIIEASEAEMISNIFEFGDKEAQDIMTHRNNIAAIDGAGRLRDAIFFMLEGKNSRYPVYEENIDHIVGILHLKDAMRYHQWEEKLEQPVKNLTELLREPRFVPQTKNIDELFREMQRDKLQMVIVVDEYGQTDGLLAMEDILEEIVGNIQDEYDEDRTYIEEKGEDEYILEGKTPLEELEERFHIRFDNEDFETLNGYLISKLDRIPEPDEDFDVDHDGYNFKILSVENKMVTRVLLTRLPGPEESALEQNGEQ